MKTARRRILSHIHLTQQQLQKLPLSAGQGNQAVLEGSSAAGCAPENKEAKVQ